MFLILFICFHNLFCHPPTLGVTFRCVTVVIHCLSKSCSPSCAKISHAGMNKVQGPHQLTPRETTDVLSQQYMYISLWGIEHVSGLGARGQGTGWRREQNSWEECRSISERIWGKPGGASLVVLPSEKIGQVTATLAALLWVLWESAVGGY